MNTKLYFLILAMFAAVAIAGCKKDEDEPPAPPANEEELITTLRLHFTSANDVEHLLFEFMDLDGDGGNAPMIVADTLSADSVYTLAIEVLDESGTPTDTITAEILAEDEAHQFFFQVSGANATVTYTDADADGNPVGLSTTWTVGAVSNGSVIVTLRHEPDKGAAGVSSGNITNAGGETDIEVTFPMVIE